MRPLIWICIVFYMFAMAGVSFVAHRIVGNFGVVGALLTIAAMYGAAVCCERRQEGKKIEILPPRHQDKVDANAK
jgi:hypothetical protein